MRPRIESISLVDRERYSRAFHYVQEQERMGNSLLVNLSFASGIELDSPLSRVYQQARAPFVLHVNNPEISPMEFVVFSPEGFLHIAGRRASTRPMKGTALSESELTDTRVREALLASAKEAAEHRTIVDLMRNDLGMICERVWVQDYRYLERIRVERGSLFATSSLICGELDPHWPSRFGSILEAILPAGSISGAPKLETRKIIARAEEDERGFYTGVAGFFGPWGLESWVLIRFIQRGPAGTQFRSGGGITVYSEEESEYQELEAKIAIPY